MLVRGKARNGVPSERAGPQNSLHWQLSLSRSSGRLGVLTVTVIDWHVELGRGCTVFTESDSANPSLGKCRQMIGIERERRARCGIFSLGAGFVTQVLPTSKYLY